MAENQLQVVEQKMTPAQQNITSFKKLLDGNFVQTQIKHARQIVQEPYQIKRADPTNILLQALLLNISVHTLPEKKIGKADKKSGTAQ